MTRNENNADRTGRVVLGLVILSLLFVGPKTWWGLMGLLPLSTGVVGWCPVYQMFGLNTCKRTSLRSPV